MEQQKLLLEISESLARFRAQVSILNAGALLDINIISEDFLIPILNELFDCNLINANKISKNFPGVDLIDKKNKICFQITSTNTQSKIKTTIENVIKHNLYEEFERIYVFIITEKKSNYNLQSLREIIETKFNFTNENIIDHSDIFIRIKSMPIEQIRKIGNYFHSQYTDTIKTSEILNSNFQNILRNVHVKMEEKIILAKLEAAQNSKMTWQDKKGFLETHVASISDLNQKYTVQKNIQECETKILNYEKEIISIITQISIQNE